MSLSPLLIIHRIQIDTLAETITFQGGYTPEKGPLPKLVYPLTGLWVYEEHLIKVIFEVDKLPLQAGDILLHRYEAERCIQPSQAAYRYFTICNHAGMVLGNQACGKIGIQRSWHHLLEEDNKKAVQRWAALNGYKSEDLNLVEVPDSLNRYSPVILQKEENL